jgi:Ser/Thr protein kinase RdoA (MazF antagonist)
VNELGSAVAKAFGLGTPTTAAASVGGGGSHLMWRLATTTGEWAVKQLNRSREQWWIDDFEIAATVEQSAWASGIPMPRPVPPSLMDLTVGGEQISVQVHEWRTGRPVDTTDPAVQTWIGRTMAAVHALSGPAPPADTALHDPAEWRAWLDDAPPSEADLVLRVRERLPDIARAKDFADRSAAELGPSLTPVFTHRDVRPANMLMTTAGPVLLDWDGAGVEHAEWEAVRSALECARPAAGQEPDRAAFRRILAGYGRDLPAGPAAFGGLVRGQLRAGAWLLWRALGHRPVTPAERDMSRSTLRDTLAAVHTALTRIPEWTTWLPRPGRSPSVRPG